MEYGFERGGSLNRTGKRLKQVMTSAGQRCDGTKRLNGFWEMLDPDMNAINRGVYCVARER